MLQIDDIYQQQTHTHQKKKYNQFITAIVRVEAKKKKDRWKGFNHTQNA